MTPWKQGDRVVIRLPAGKPWGRAARRWIDVHGTVVDVDLPGLPPGVKVEFDNPVLGSSWCYATHEELRPAGVGGSGPGT